VDSKAPSGVRRVERPSEDAAWEVARQVGSIGMAPALPYTVGTMVQLLQGIHGVGLNKLANATSA
jgi:hypothetical protein